MFYGKLLVTLDEIGSKPSSRTCSRRHVFISVSDAFLAISKFSNTRFFSNSLNKKRMSGGSKLIRKKDKSPGLFKSK